MILEIGDILKEASVERALSESVEAVFITSSVKLKEAFKQIGMNYYGDVELQTIGFNKVETHQDCIMGTLYVPKLNNILEQRFCLQFFINEKYIVMVDDSEFAYELIEKIIEKKPHHCETKAMFLFNFFTEFMSKDLEVLGQYEKMLMRIEENIMSEKAEDYQNELIVIRKKLLTLRGYYSEISDMGKILEDNENELFKKKEVRYFGIISDRAERLMGKARHLLEYAGQISDIYQSKEDRKQSANMQFLTIISTIFFPLTLITGWYGMNFKNMPELNNGYPGVAVLSVIVVIVCIVIFKIKKIF